MRAPTASSSRGVIAFTVPYVPTGMKIGVGTSPCANCNRPARALPHVFSTRKLIGFADDAAPRAADFVYRTDSLRSSDQHRVAVAVKAIPRAHRLRVRREHALFAGERADEHQQRRARQM